MNNIEQVREVMNDMEFVQSLLELDAPEAVQEAFQKKGISLTLDEVLQIGKLISAQGEADELSEDALENVAGGIALETIIVIVNGVALAVKIGTVIKKNYGW